MFIPKPIENKNTTTIHIVGTDPTKISRGHKPHRGGAGKHADRRTNRLRTRATQLQQALKD